MRERLRKARLFVGPRVMRLLVISFVLAIGMSWVEVGFAVLIQAFLLALGILPRAAAMLPSWAPDSLYACVGLIIGVAFARSVLYWFKSFSHGLITEAYQVYKKSLIVRWALVHTNWDSNRVVTLLTDRVQTSAYLVSGVHGVLANACTGAAIFVYLLYLSWQLALFGIGALVLLGLGLKSFDGRIRREAENVVHLSTEINARVLDALRNLFFVRICRFERREAGLITKRLELLYRSTWRNLSISSVKFAAPQFLGVVLIMGISVVARRLSLLEGGVFLSFVYLFMRVSQQIADLSASSATVRMYYPHFAELFAWFEAHEKEIFAPAMPEKADSGRHIPPASWELRDVSLTLGGNPILKNQSMSIEPGKVTVLRGPSGAGKSTILSMLAGFLPPTSGKVAPGGTGETRFGYVGPEPAVISGTIRENLLYGLDEGSLDETKLAKILSVTSCTEFIDQHPDKLDRRISDRGEGLSTGQKQRLSMARALLRDPNVLLLDEPTANLDERSKGAIIEALLSLRDRTTIVIATHDDSLARIGDQVVQLQVER